ncbi:hypothetical protein F511_32403 [Dorcoceras hygrometricum]|uniref:Uncharacterized protein n=1 Tax=Dorcoceras hygrometricum TaxID=472368 RepID=A0A2Z7BX19_9LAMI|nr:hypothetical protein F511_32403 [Dorcoceras hygrometricum]
MVMIHEKRQKKHASIVKKAKHFYMDTMCNCSRLENGGIINCTIPQTAPITRPKSHGPDGQDLQELMRLAVSSKKGGGTMVEVDSEGNLVCKKSGADGRSYGAGVGRMGRIDEERTCDFKEIDVTKIWYTRSFSNHKRLDIN